jgi:hypothetical protein
LIKCPNNFSGHLVSNALKTFRDTSKFGTFLKCPKKFLGHFLEILGHFEVPLNINRDVVQLARMCLGMLDNQAIS